ncbi:sensor histidine kinase [Glycomyces terrestris]|uniref:sensor histidine kinase n=1 Tax=Glycomyces terrestris TaxID=2493553 RepID=UPI0013152A4B|nr:histidine kinase [Glycomyces terrestris]
MRTQVKQAFGAGAAAAVVIGGAVGLAWAPWTAVLPAVAAAVALAAPGARAGRYRRTGTAALAAAAVSLLCTLLHRVPVTGAAGFWLLLELAALAGLAASAVRHAPARRAALAGALAAAALGAQPLRMLLGTSATWTEYVFFTGAWTLVALGAVATGLARRLAARRRERTRAEMRRRERLALAGDLHDLVAHDVTGIVLDAQATRAEGDPAQAPEALARIERAGLEALAAMDRTVGMLRGGESPGARTYGVADVPELVDRFAAAARAPVVLELDPDLPGRVPREAADAVYRLVAEALTNVRRHAPHAGGVEVALTAHDAALEIRILSAGGRESPRPRLPRLKGHGGTGLLALTARFEALGGELRAGPGDGGWLVAATLPLLREAA